MPRAALPGASSLSSSSLFATSLLTRKLTPVRLPPGRLRLATRPSSTGSPPVTKTIGSVDVAGLAASAEAVVFATSTLT
jgi:hypothetical protein